MVISLIIGRRTEIPSYQVRPGETVTLRGNDAQMPTVIEARRPLSPWLNRTDTTGQVTGLPEHDYVDLLLRKSRSSCSMHAVDFGLAGRTPEVVINPDRPTCAAPQRRKP